MMQLIPTIVIGKKYLLRPALWEMVTPCCGTVMGRDSEPIVVTIDGTQDKAIHCRYCNEWFEINPDGFYTGFTDTWKNLWFPYSQLTEIEGENYEL